MPAKCKNATVSFGEIVQSALCVAKVGLAKLSCKKAGNQVETAIELFDSLGEESFFKPLI